MKEEVTLKDKLKELIERIENIMKPDNQTAKKDAGKPKLTLVPLQILYDIAEVREYGNSKYGSPENWKDVDPQRYRDALFRHLVLYLENPDGVDEESGLPHLSHVACNVAFLCQMRKNAKGDTSHNSKELQMPLSEYCKTYKKIIDCIDSKDGDQDPYKCSFYSISDGKCKPLGCKCKHAWEFDRVSDCFIKV